VKTVFVNIGALDPRTARPVAKRDELIKDIKKGFRLFGDSNRLLFSVTIKCLMELVKIFSTPSRIGKSSLKTANLLLHFPFPMDGLENMPFSINLIATLEILGVVCVMFFQKRLFWWNVVKKELVPTILWTIYLSKRELTVQRWLGRTFGFASSGTKR